MAVLVEAISVIVRLETIAEKYPGGVTQYMQDCPNGTFCMDEDLARVGFMSPEDVHDFVWSLERLGMRCVGDGCFDEVAVADQIQGISYPCDWLVYFRLLLFRGNIRVSLCQISGKTPGVLAFPCGWDYENSLSKSTIVVDTGDVEKRMFFLRHEKGMDYFLDTFTGEEVNMGRTAKRRANA